MLTKALAIADYDFAAGRIVPDCLTRRAHRGYLAFARQMIDAYRLGTGCTRIELRDAVRLILAADPRAPPRRANAFAKLLDDSSDFLAIGSADGSLLRNAVFSVAARFHPLGHPLRQAGGHAWDRALNEVRSAIAQQLALPWEEIAARLYADVSSDQRLVRYRGPWEPSELLAQYNVAQFQASFYRAANIVAWAESDFKSVVRYAKLARLMHAIERVNQGEYRFCFDGPASILRTTPRYGIAVARFAGNLLKCRQWRLRAAVRPTGSARLLKLEADSKTAPGAGKRHSADQVGRPLEFDSAVEQRFAEAWGNGSRGGWTLHREDELLVSGQKVFTPDFSLRRGAQTRVFLEIVGFWTPEYLKLKTETLRMFATSPIMLAVPRRSRLAWVDLNFPTVWYGAAPKVADVLGLLETTPWKRW